MMLNTNGVYLPANTSHLYDQPCSALKKYKAKFKRLFIQWIITVLKAHSEQDVEETDDSPAVIQWYLSLQVKG